MNIAFCTNITGLAGLGTTVLSLVRNCSDSSRLQIWFLCADLGNKEKNNIEKLLLSEAFSGKYLFIDFDPIGTFGSFCSLHGDWTPYGKLLLGDFLNVDQVLYLDSDLIVERDVLELHDFNFQGCLLGAVVGCKLKYALGSKFYINEIGLSAELAYFNSGVLMLNLKEWRLQKIKEACLNIAKCYPAELPSHDQSLLNIICAGNFARIPSSFNCEWSASESIPNVSDRMIFHFVGSPKPWDPLGAFLHNGYQSWLKYQNSHCSLTGGKYPCLKRAWSIRRSYLRCFRNKFIR